MTSRCGCALLAACLACAFGATRTLAADAPSWMHAQVSAPVPQHDDKTDAVALYAETLLTVQPNGKIKRLRREAVKILRPDGESWGRLQLYFDAQSPITALRAWSIPASGKDYEVKERDAVESAVLGVGGGELMTDMRTKTLMIPAAIPGSIVGYELEQELRPYALMDEWYFQDQIPVREAHYSLSLPPGWTYKTNWINHAEEAPRNGEGGRKEWEVRDLRAIRLEPHMPPWSGIAGNMVLALVPPSGHDAGIQSWHELGAWYLTLARDRRAASPEIKQKVAALTASIPTTFGKMQALAAFVQSDIRYVAIELGIGGQQPHAASDVLNHHYGDCKDKANLLIVMLKEIGIDAYEVAINTVRGSVEATSPPGLYFNHDIVAIALPETVGADQAKAVLAHPKLGRILFFDPTDELVPLGLLPGALQANYGLLVAPEVSELVKLPQLDLDTNGTLRAAKLTLDEQGTLRGDVHEVRNGDHAAQQRGVLRGIAAETDRIRPVEAIAAQSLSTYRILNASAGNLNAVDRPFEWNYTLQVANYAKPAGDLLLVRPRVLGILARGFLETKEPRENAIEFEGPERDTDTFEIALPAGYEVDELPPPLDLDVGFASYHSKTETVGRTLRYTRTAEFKDLSVPAAQAGRLKEFYRKIGDDERNSAILKLSSR